MGLGLKNKKMNQKTDYKLIFSLIAVGFFWGTTYLGIRIAVETVPPWFITSIRQGIAAIIVLSIVLYKKELAWIGWKNLQYQFIPAVVMIVIANGFTTIAEQTLPSGLTSILSALSPVVVFLGSILVGIEKPTLKGFLGLILGFLGVVFIFKDGLSDILDPNYKIGILFLSIAILSWASGTVYTKTNIHKSNNIALNLLYQFSIASIIQLFLAFYFSSNTDIRTWSFRSIFAIVYMAIFGSVVAFFCYHYALKRVSALQVSILNYVNTIIAVFLGWLLLDEVIKLDFIVATILIMLGVFIINYKKKPVKLKQQ